MKPVPTVLIVPGLHGSGPEHWQSWFEQKLAGTVRVEQDDWETPDLPRWAGAVQREIHRARGPLWIVAHSFGCLATAYAARRHAQRVAGVMFVAPADPDKFKVAAHLPVEHFPFPSVVVASTNDPWVGLTKAAYWADLWGSRFINLGAAGHINIDSGYGAWPEGLAIFQALQRAQQGLPLGAFEADVPPRPASAQPRHRRPGRGETRLQSI